MSETPARAEKKTSKRILSVDDDPSILDCYETALKKKGYDIIVTSDPDEVARIIRDEDLDLVMLDIRMPKRNGLDIFKELKKRKNELPILFVTAYPRSFCMESEETADMWENEFADGNTDILYKPFDLDALYEKIEGLIGPADGGS